MFRNLQALCRAQNFRKRHLHLSPWSPKTWTDFQFLKTSKSSSLRSPPGTHPPIISADPPGPPISSPLSVPPNLSPPQHTRPPQNHAFYSTCSEKPPKPPKKPDCSPKPKKCAEESPCNENLFESFCPDYKDPASCSTNKPKCPEKCPEAPKPSSPKPCPQAEDKPVCSKPKPCAASEDRSICIKPKKKPSGCGGKPPPCSRSYSSCAAAEMTNKVSGLTFGEKQRRKLQVFCARRKSTPKPESTEIPEQKCQGSEKDESFGERVSREKGEMSECLKTLGTSALGYTRIHCRECIRDIISRDAKRFLRELDPYSAILHKRMERVLLTPAERAKRKNNWIDSMLTQQSPDA